MWIKLRALLICVLVVLFLSLGSGGCSDQLAPTLDAGRPDEPTVDARPAPPPCDIPPGFVVFGQGCGGSKINGLTCAVGCVVVDEPDGAYPVDAGRVPLAIGCRLPPQIAGGGICVADCRDCQ